MSNPIFAGVVLLAVVLSACGGEILQTPLTEDDDGTSITLAQGETFDVYLRSNESTGYSWEILEIGENLNVASSEYRRDNVPANVDGAGGHELMRFEAVAAGTHDLSLHYKQAWEDDSTAAGHWKISVTVE